MQSYSSYGIRDTVERVPDPRGVAVGTTTEY
jgi:hypothetical protein